MQSIDITAKVKNYIRFGLFVVIALAAAIGYGEYEYWHKDEVIELENAKVAGTMVSVRVLANGKVKELLFEDGAEVKVGEVIARLEVAITAEEIEQLENTVQLARDNYAELAAGQWVKVPVQRERVTYPPAPPPTIRYSAPSANLSKLEERANRMAELYDMGAVSAVQRDAARRAYESALAESQTPTYEYYEAPAPIIEYYTEYVDEFRATPQEVLDGAEQAIKQAELSLNVARQEARETDVIAPVSGTIYYGVEIEEELVAGDSVSKIGDSRELWIEAEVTEEIFNKIPLGKLVSYSIDGRELFGTVIEKIKPNITEPVAEEPIELPEIPTTENAPAPLITENPAQPTEDSETEEKIREIINSVRENPQIVEAQTETLENPEPSNENAHPEENPEPSNENAQPEENPEQSNENAQPEENPEQSNENAQPEENPEQSVENAQPEENPEQSNENAQPEENPEQSNENAQPPQIVIDNQPKPNDKFIIKISLPAERDFDCRPNTKTTVKIKF